MDAAVIKFKASGQQLSVVSTNLFAANTVNYIRAEFELGDGWDGFDVVRAVWATDFAKIATILDTDGVTMVPWEVLKRTATLYVNLVGSISDGDELTDRLTTYKAKALDVNGCTNVDGDNTQPITPSQFDQFVAIVHDDAEAAADARDEAKGYADDAEGYRDEAVGAAADAKDYRDAAKGYADDAEDYKDQAKGYADEAEADAEEIRNMTATATTLPEGSSATASYSDGVLSLGIPKGDTGATGATGNGIASAVLNADYTLTLNFTDGTHYTTPPIRGAQGVQGETGNGIDRIELTDTTGAVKTYTIYFTDGSTYDFEVTDGEVTLAELASVLPTDTASGAIASFEDGSDLFDYLSCIVDIEPVQSGSGTPSPDNVRPITGWTGCEVDVANETLWDEQWELGGINATTGEGDSSTDRFRSKNFVPCKEGTSYYFNCPSANWRMFFYDANKTFKSYIGTYSAPRVVTIPSGVAYLKFWIIGTTYGNNISINYPSTDTTYHAHNPNSAVYPVSWQTEAGTVYGGTVDVVNGVLTADMKYDQMTYAYLSALTSPYISFVSNITQVGGNAVWVRNWNYTDYPANIDGGIKATCNAFPVSMHNKTIISSQYRIYFGVGSMESVAEFLTAVQALETNGDGLWIAHELATPITYELDPVQVACLLGHNNVWADCGDIEEVKYKADVQLWVEKMLNA